MATPITSEGAGCSPASSQRPCALDPAHRLGDEGLTDGEVLVHADLEVHIVGTPATSDSVSMHLPQRAALLTGDTILGRSTAVVAHPDGRLGDYLASLRELSDLVQTAGATQVRPGHGPVLPDAAAALTAYLTTAMRVWRRWPQSWSPRIPMRASGDRAADRRAGLRRRAPGAVAGGAAERTRTVGGTSAGCDRGGSGLGRDGVPPPAQSVGLQTEVPGCNEALRRRAKSSSMRDQYQSTHAAATISVSQVNVLPKNTWSSCGSARICAVWEA